MIKPPVKPVGGQAFKRRNRKSRYSKKTGMGRIAMDIGCENLPLLGNEDGYA